MNKPSISVLMSVYNGGKYLADSIQSICAQSFDDFEFIIIDDASTDETPCILNKYALQDARIKIFTNQENLGLTRSLNLGLDQATGEFIARQDADDISLPTRLQCQVEYMKNNPECELLGCAYFSFNENDIFPNDTRVIIPPANLPIALCKNNCLCHGSVMWRRAVGLKYDPAFKFAQDYELWTRFSLRAPIHFLKTPLYKLRIHENSISITKKNEQKKYAQEISKKHIDNLVKNRKYDILLYVIFISFMPVDMKQYVKNIIMDACAFPFEKRCVRNAASQIVSKLKRIDIRPAILLLPFAIRTGGVAFTINWIMRQFMFRLRRFMLVAR